MRDFLQKSRTADSRRFGFSLPELVIVMGIIAILALAAIPNLQNLRVRAYEALAKSAAANARVSQRAHFELHDGQYATDLENLLRIDRNLSDDPAITFVFGTVNSSGYTMIVGHAQGVDPVVVTD
ncbi:MAG: prepilin-type N-terminal cleavage/methylation domain-containing protein [Deltaproteobacteria bacterium]|nr:prepilin-type N-terminal cleavage/methylation domain-containing protein [Deltaproteobacteria bacterium]